MPGRLLALLPLHACHAAALRRIWARPMNSVLKGLAGGPGWTKAQFTLVVDRLAKAPYGAIIATDLYAALDRNEIAATKVVEALVEANMLACRPPSGGHWFAGTGCLLCVQWSTTLQSRAPCCAE